MTSALGCGFSSELEAEAYARSDAPIGDGAVSATAVAEASERRERLPEERRTEVADRRREVGTIEEVINVDRERYVVTLVTTASAARSTERVSASTRRRATACALSSTCASCATALTT